MAHKYLDSVTGNDADAPFESAATAAATLAGLLAGTTVAVNEHIWVDDSHAEITTGTVTLTSPSTTNPQRLLCVSDFDASPETLSTGAEIATNNNYAINFSGVWRVRGVTFAPAKTGSTGSSSNTTSCYSTTGPHYQVFESCRFNGANHTSGMPLILGSVANASSDASVGIYKDCTVKFVGATAATILFNWGRHTFDNLTLDGTGVVPTELFRTRDSTAGELTIVNSDLTGLALTALVNASIGGTGNIWFRNCKIPNAVAVIKAGGFLAPGLYVYLINCDSGDTNIRHECHSYEGSWYADTAIYATTDPALDAAAGNTYSVRMAASANVSRWVPLYSQWFSVWVPAGQAYTPEIEVLVSGDGAAALNSDELWVEVDYNSGADSPLGARVTSAPGILTAGSAVAAGTTAWTGDGYTTERTHKLSVAAVTPDKSGWVQMRVALAKASATIYVNPPRP
jgi:hypothetical protein